MAPAYTDFPFPKELMERFVQRQNGALFCRSGRKLTIATTGGPVFEGKQRLGHPQQPASFAALAACQIDHDVLFCRVLSCSFGGLA